MSAGVGMWNDDNWNGVRVGPTGYEDYQQFTPWATPARSRLPSGDVYDVRD
jgi:hypothetical protein